MSLTYCLYLGVTEKLTPFPLKTSQFFEHISNELEKKQLPPRTPFKMRKQKNDSLAICRDAKDAQKLVIASGQKFIVIKNATEKRVNIWLQMNTIFHHF